jgi:hypothetical protein
MLLAHKLVALLYSAWTFSDTLRHAATDDHHAYEQQHDQWTVLAKSKAALGLPSPAPTRLQLNGLSGVPGAWARSQALNALLPAQMVARSRPPVQLLARGQLQLA